MSDKDVFKGAPLTDAETTDVVVSDLAYASPQVQQDFGTVHGFRYDKDLSELVEKRLVDRGLDPVATGFQGSLYNNPATNEWEITFAGTTGWVDLVEDKNFISGNYVYEGEKTIRRAVMWITCHAIPVGRLNATRHKPVT